MMLANFRRRLNFKDPNNRTTNRADTFARIYVVYLISSAFYIGSVYIVPWANADTLPYIKYQCLCVFLTFQCSVNWLLVRLVKPIFVIPNKNSRIKWVAGKPIADDFRDITGGLMKESNMDNNNGNIKESRSGAEKTLAWNLEWSFCEWCQQPCPPRAHHCFTCAGCVLKKDHHCFFAGRCVGFRNQRFFIVFVFYTALVSFLGLYMEPWYISAEFLAPEPTWWDYAMYVPPVGTCLWLTGYVPAHVYVMLTHVWSASFMAPLTAGMFLGQMFSLLNNGQTPHENSCGIKAPPRGLVFAFRSVFGSYWPLNFIIPAHWILAQEGNGTTWFEDSIVNRYKKIQ